jgi:hypothetical protein
VSGEERRIADGEDHHTDERSDRDRRPLNCSCERFHPRHSGFDLTEALVTLFKRSRDLGQIGGWKNGSGGPADAGRPIAFELGHFRED